MIQTLQEEGLWQGWPMAWTGVTRPPSKKDFREKDHCTARYIHAMRTRLSTSSRPHIAWAKELLPPQLLEPFQSARAPCDGTQRICSRLFGHPTPQRLPASS